MLKINRDWTFWFLVFNSSFTAMTSQMLLGYLIGIVTGSVYKQYSLIMGLFVFFMGFGAFAFQTVKRPGWILAVLQILSPLLVLSVWLMTPWTIINGRMDYPYLLQLAVISVIGVFSGAELPLIERITRGAGKSDYDRILFYDYLAMSGATVLFGLALLTFLGVKGSITLIACGHLLTLVTLAFGVRPIKMASE